MQKLLIVSADSHVGGRMADYADFIDPGYREALHQLAEVEEPEYLAMFGPFSTFTDKDLAIMDTRQAIRTGGVEGGWNVQRRLREMDAEGIAAEIVHPGHQGASMPFFGQVNKPYPADYRMAGARAHHRWLAHCITQANGRIHGVGDPGPCLDMDETVDELRWIAENGFVSVAVPGNIADDALPPLYDRYYDPFWRACVEHSLVLSVHAGWGAKQGAFFDFAKHISPDGNIASVLGAGNVSAMTDALRDAEYSPFALNIGPRRIFWQLLLGGVFDRFPALRLAFTEIRADWVPATLAFLDKKFNAERPEIKRKPSEYFSLHCYVGPSSTRPSEIAIRSEVGLEKMMFGVDYPHPEGTWPNTHDWLRTILGDLSETEISRFLAGNAIECYGLDRPHLLEIAQKIGPDPKMLLQGAAKVDPRIIQHFNIRSDYGAPVEEVDLIELGAAVQEDMESTRYAA